MKMTPYILMLLFLIFSMHSNGQVKDKAKYNYDLYLPKDYSSSVKKYPLLIYLHGGSQRGNDINKLKVYGMPYLVQKGHDFNFIIASPQCPADKYWSSENWFEPLYSNLMSQYRIDTTRVYCTGISMGGYGTYIVALDFPDTFAAIIPLCGGINDSDTMRVCNLSKTPIWTFHGTADDQISIHETERIVNGLRKCNGKIKFTKLKDRGHGIEDLYETKPEIYEWLLKNKK